MESENVTELFRAAFRRDDAEAIRAIFERNPALKSRINDPVAAFDAPLIVVVRSREMLDVLLSAGADINAKSRWWAGGFGLLHCASPDLAAYAIERGAVVDAQAAARLGKLDRLRELVGADPGLVHSRGGDGQLPLHFAANTEVAEYLLEQGAEIDARDIDHESTAAQWMVRERQEVARLLVRRGGHADLLIAAALGDVDLIQRLLDADPECIRLRVNEHFFPKRNPRSGGTIYQWTLGFHVSPHEVAKQFGHEEVFQVLMARSPADVKLLAACWSGADEAAVKALVAEHPELTRSVTDAYAHQVADAARNNNLGAVRLMLAAGLPVDGRGQHGGTPLHWAAWHGNAEMVKLLLSYRPPLESSDNDFHAKPIGWAVHGSENGWNRDKGDYGATVEALLASGAQLLEKLGGTDVVQAVLRRHGLNE